MTPVKRPPRNPKALEALARKHGVSGKGTRRNVLRRVGRKIEPTFDMKNYLGEADAPPSGSFLKDTFSGATTSLEEHTGETGATWVTSLAMTVEEGFIRGNSTTYRYAYASGLPALPASPDYSVEVGLICKSVTAARQTGPALRISIKADTSYQWVWVTNEGFSLVKRIAGEETVLATYAFVGEVGQKPVATISAVGTAIKAFVNGVERASATDSAITEAGRAGLRQQGIASQGAVTDYIIATDAAVHHELHIEDSITLSDSAKKGAKKAQADSLGLSDQLAKAVGHTDADSVTLSDGTATGAGHTEADSITLSDGIGTQVGKLLSDAFSLADSMARGAGRFITDLLGLSDLVAVFRPPKPTEIALSVRPKIQIDLVARPQITVALSARPKTDLTLEARPQ